MDKDKIATDVRNIVTRQRRILQSIVTELDSKLPQWKSRTIRFLAKYVTSEELSILSNINSSTYETDKDLFLEYLVDLEKGIVELPNEYLILDPFPDDEQRTKTKPSISRTTGSKKVFVVHGHDSLVKTEVARMLEKLDLEPIVLHEQPNEGKTIIEKFERDASQVQFAVAILTPDDEGYPVNKPGEKKKRARQNVILELGYFSGILGRENVCVLFKGDLEVPSDYLGVVYVEIDNAGAWRFNLAKELMSSGLDVDLNKLV